MKKIQKIRLAVQVFCVLLTLVGFFTNFQVTMLIVMAATLIGGVYYCGWMCPFGTLQDIASKIGKVLKIKKVKMPKAIQKYVKYSRYIIAVAFTIFSLDILYSLFVYDPRVNFSQYLNGMFTGFIPLLVMISFLLISLFFERPFCNYLCMEGAKYGIISSLRVFTIKRDESSCIGCHKCDQVCPMNIEVSKKEQVQSLQCINCFECISVCPVEKTLSYEKLSFTDKMKKKYGMVIGILISCLVVGGIIFAITGALPFDMPIGEDQSIDQTSEANIDATSTEEIIIEEIQLGDLGDAAGIENGVYEGVGRGFRGDMTVEVTVVNQMIREIEVIEHSEDRKFYTRAEPSVTEDIIDRQSVDVDTVSGATYSSVGIIEAVTNALESAVK